MSFNSTARRFKNAAIIVGWIAAAIIVSYGSAQAQGCGPQNPNCTVPTAPPGTSDNRAASTAFVTGNVTFNQLPSGFFFTQNGAKVDRLNDRLFVGGATANDGAFPLTNLDWLSAYAASISGLGNYMCCTQAAILTQAGGAELAASSSALTVGARSSGFTSASTAGLAMTAIGVNNNATLNTNVWAYYGECHRQTSAVGACYGMELDPTAHVTSGGPANPYGQGIVVGIQDACGAGVTATLFPCNAAIQIVPNPQTFGTGINFLNGSITANAGPNSTTQAIALPSSYSIVWQTAANTFGGSINVDASGHLNEQATGQVWLQPGAAGSALDCNVVTAATCSFNENVSVLGGFSLSIRSAGSIFFDNAGNTDSYSMFDNAGTWQFQHNGGNIFTVSSIGSIDTNGSVSVRGGNAVVIHAAGSLFLENSGDTDSYNLFVNGSTLTFQHGGGTFMTINTAAATGITFNPTNTGGANNLVIDNPGTTATSGTASQFVLSLSGAANTQFLMQLVGGANPNVLINTSSSVSGMAINPNNYLLLGPTSVLFLDPGGLSTTIGGGDGASAVNELLKVEGIAAGNANTASGTLTIQGALSNGTGAGGDIIFTTTNNSAGSGVQNSASEALRFTAGTHNPKFRTSSVGASTQTFTNSPCTGLTTERWVSVEITGQTGTWFVPACQ